MRYITKSLIILGFTLLLSVGLNAQSWKYVETFEHHNADEENYSDGNFEGDNSITWTYVRGRADNGYKVNAANKSFVLGNPSPNASIKSALVSGGINNFKVSMIKAFGGNSERQVALYINGSLIANSESWTDGNVHTFQVNDIEITGNVEIEIRNLGAQVAIDNVSWTQFGAGSGGFPSKVIVSKLRPTVPMANIPFKALLELVDNNGYSQVIPAQTRIILQVLDASANLLHQETVYIPANSSVLFVENLNLNYSGNVIFNALAPDNKDPLGYYLDDTDAMFAMAGTPKLHLDIYHKGHVGAVHPEIVVSALDNDGNVNTYYNGYTGNLNITSGTFSGTVSGKFTNGVLKFNDIVFNTADVNYSVSASAQYLVDSDVETVSVLAPPTMTEIVLPRYLKGEGSLLSQSGNGRLPSFALVQFSNLHPNTEYRFTTGATVNVPNTSSQVPGNNLVYNATTNTYSYVSDKNLVNAGAYTSFVTGNGETNKTMWINLVPTNDGTFAVNNETHWTVDMGFETGSLITRLYSTNTSRNLRLSSTANDFDGGVISYASGLYDPHSPSTPKNYIVVYDENNTPISTAIVQANGSSIKAQNGDKEAPDFYSDYEFTSGAWSTFIPNNLPGGVRKIAEFNTSGNVLKEWTDNDGVWAGYNTELSNYGMYPPEEGDANIAFAVPTFNLVTPNTGVEVCNNEGIPIIWNSRGMDYINIYISDNAFDWELVASNVDARTGSYMWMAPRYRYSEQENYIRIESIEFPQVNYTSGIFNVYDNPIITGYSNSNVWCPEEVVAISVDATGSNLTFQWYKDGKALVDNDDYQGTHSPELTIKSLLHRLSGNYTAKVSGHPSCPSQTTGPIIVYTAVPLSIMRPTSDVFIGLKLGDKATLEFTVHGNGGNGEQTDIEKYNYKIQWYKYDPNLPVDVPLDDAMPRFAGSKSNYLTINKFRKQDEGKYYAVVKGLCNSSVKTPYFEVREAGLFVTNEPENINSCLDADVEFTFDYSTSGSEIPEIAWYKDGNKLEDDGRITGVNTRTLSILNVVASDEGSYKAVITDSNNEESTKSAILSVFKPVVITSQTEGPVNVEIGKQLSLEVVAQAGEDDMQLSYHWFKNNIEIDNAFESTLVISEVSQEDEGIYTCYVSDLCGSVASQDIEVIITTAITSVKEVSRLGFSISEVSPNPVSNNFNINVKSPEMTMATLVITDMTGRTIATVFDGVLEEGIHNLQMDLSKLNIANGAYFITLRTPKVALTQNFNVVR